MVNKGEDGGGVEALSRLKETEPPLFLTPSSDLSLSSRSASEFLFSSLKPYTRKSPFDKLLTNGFDAEQIWQQIDLQSQPLVSSLRREIKRFEQDPVRISNAFDALVRKVGSGPQSIEVADMRQDDDSEFDELEDEDDEEEEKGSDSEESGDDDEMKENEMEEESEDDRSEEKKVGGSVVEDKFLKIKELEKYLKEDEEREYGLKIDTKAGSKKTSKKDEEDEDEDDDEEDGDDPLGLFEDGGSDEDEDEELANARYEDFYVSNNKNSKKIRKQKDVSDDSGAEDDQEDNKSSKKIRTQKDVSDDFGAEDDQEDNKKEKKLSRHEIEQKKIQAKIAEMEKANMDPKTWTMQGEVTAAKRPLNSALEADLDFEHNVRPPPVITEEVTVSIEEIIKKRINEGRFDGVQRAPKLPSNAPREFKELDESKSKKGLADIYEEEYLEKTGLAPASLSFSDELKKEANLLFKQLTFKLNALSHFHFAPKPVVEDMAVETNLPALAMEEVAPMAVSDAAMLAPEEVFAGKGNVKEEAELTQEDRKRRRAKNKRKHKAEERKRAAKKPKEIPVITQGEGKVAVIKA